MWHEVLRWSLLALALGPFGYYLLAITAAWRFFRNRPPISRDFAPPVSILKPVRGLDREAYENYVSFCVQEYPEFEIIFGVTEITDPAVPVIEKIIRDFPNLQIRLLIGAEELGASDKLNKLCRMVREAKHDILIISDGDIRVAQG
ncbi:MAG: glycosyltransferase, partial [Candidatus Acidiferrales bacterium]